jgi:hypothetical protein
LSPQLPPLKLLWLITLPSGKSRQASFGRVIPVMPRAIFNARRRLFMVGGDHISTLPVQQKIMASFLANGQPLEWHLFPCGNHGFASPESGGGYQPELAERVWPLVTDFLDRELALDTEKQAESSNRK